MPIFNGTSSRDTLTGGSGNDSLYGFGGDDRILTGNGDDLVEGGDGNDEVNGFATSTGRSFWPYSGRKTVNGGIGNDFIVGGNDADQLFGEGGNDTVYGDAGDDYLDGGDGDDSLIDQASGKDTLLGGGGNDTLNAYTGTGDKLLDGGLGNDTLYGGIGNDKLVGGDGADSLDGNEGSDSLAGGLGNDTIRGGAGNDLLTGDEGLDSLSGGDGNDSISGGADNDTLNAGAGLDTLLGGAGNDVLFSRTTDMAAGFDDGANLMDGGDGDDSISAGLGDDTLIGGAGNDTLNAYTRTGNKLLDGGLGNDTLYGGIGNDKLVGGDGADSLDGNEGSDSLMGGLGDDTIRGGTGDDMLQGGDGDDSLIDQASGKDTLLGGGGSDTLNVYTGTGDKFLDGGLGNDTLYGGTGNDTLTGDEGADSLDGNEGADSLAGGLGNDTLWGGTGNDTLTGDDGTDSLLGGDGNDSISGGADNDTLRGDAGLDTLLGGAGHDLLASRTNEMAADFDDGANLMDGGDGDDSAYGGLGNDTLIGGAGNDDLQGSGGSDSLVGGLGNDTLWGGTGNDTLQGGAGDNRLSGGEGNDTYWVDTQTTVIEDTAGSDTAYVSADFTKIPSDIEHVIYANGAQPLPYWIDALLPDQAAGLAFRQLLGAGAEMRFAFPSVLPAYDDSAGHALGFTPFSAAQASRAREALAYVSSVIDLVFTETSDPSQPNTITFANNRQTKSAAYATYPSSTFKGGDLFLNVDTAGNDTLAEGTYAALTLIHEIGHSLGLKHPFSHPDADGDIGEGPYLSGVEESTAWSVMSYNDAPAQYTLRFSELDIAALQYLYGPSKSTRAGNDTYSVSATAPNFIWDGAGSDTLSVANASQGATVYLTPGYWGYIGLTKADRITAPGQITVNFGTVIENLTGSAFADRLTGNEVDNRIEGGAGGDTIEGGAGNDSIVGGDGLDTAVFFGQRKLYTVTWNAAASAFTVTSAAEGSDTLTSIETLTFSDGSYAANVFLSNTAPTLTSVSTLTGGTEDAAYPVTWSALAAAANEADAQGDAIVFSVRSVNNGTLTKNGVVVVPGSTAVAEGETLIWTPASNANGTLVAFSIRAADGTLTSASDVQVSVAVAAVNDAPVASAGSLSTPEDTQATGTLTATDVDNASLTYAVVSQPANGSVTLGANGSYSYTPAANFNGSDSFTFKANDGSADSNTATVTITVAAVNDAPAVAAPLADRSVTLGSSLNFSFGATAFTDVETANLTYTATRADGSALPAWLSFNAGTRTFSGTPASGDLGTLSVKVTASDGSLSASDTFDVVVSQRPNTAPVAANATGSTSEDTALTASLPAAIDGESDPVTYAKASNPSHGTASVTSGGSYTYTPAANYNGPDSFTYTVSDGQGGSNTYTVSLTVNAVNDAPVAAAGTLSVIEDIVATGTLVASDVDNTTLTYSVVTQPAKGTVTLGASGAYTYTPVKDANGSDSFTFRASDGALSSNTATVTITVAPVNDAPVVAVPLPDQSTLAGSAFSYSFPGNAFTDVDNAVLTYSAALSTGATLPSWLSFNPATRTFSGTPGSTNVGAIDVRVTASDGSLSASDVFSITVSDRPSATSFQPADGSKSVPVGSNLLVTFNGPVQRGTGPITLKTADGKVVETFTASNATVSGSTLTLNPTADLSIFTKYVVELAAGAVQDFAGNGNAADSRYDFKTAAVDGLYHFCVVAFGVAPGATYMADLAEAWNYGLTLRQIVDIFTTKSFFLELYPENLTNLELASRLVENIVKTSASSVIKAEGVTDIKAALDYGLSRGEVVYNVFGNLATLPLIDPVWASKWGNTAKQFQNQLTVAQHLTEIMEVKSTDIAWLRSVLADVTPDTDVSTTENIVQIIGVIPPGG